jgi:hypothetical protein
MVRIVYVSTAGREREVIACEPGDEAAHHVDERDDQARHGVAAHELAGAVHGAEELDLALEAGAPRARLASSMMPAREIGVDGHLLAGNASRVNRAATSATRPEPLGDDREVHHQQDQEHHRPTMRLPPTANLPNASMTCPRRRAPTIRAAG